MKLFLILLKGLSENTIYILKVYFVSFKYNFCIHILLWILNFWSIRIYYLLKIKLFIKKREKKGNWIYIGALGRRLSISPDLKLGRLGAQETEWLPPSCYLAEHELLASTRVGDKGQLVSPAMPNSSLPSSFSLMWTKMLIFYFLKIQQELSRNYRVLEKSKRSLSLSREGGRHNLTENVLKMATDGSEKNPVWFQVVSLLQPQLRGRQRISQRF